MPYDCEEVVAYLPLDCETDKFSFDKIVAVGFIKNADKDFALSATWDYEDAAALAADISVIPAANGEYDGGEPNITQEDAYGAKLEQMASRKHTLTFRVEYNAKNRNFFNKASFAKNFGVVFVSGNMDSLTYSGKVRATVAPKMPIGTDLQKVRFFEVVVTWSEINLAIPVSVPADQIALFE